MMGRHYLWLATLAALTGCSATPSGSLEHTFPALTLQGGEERDHVCQSWTLHNDTPLYVNAVDMHNGSGWHHSNWVFVPDDHYGDEDGVWDCPSRNFDGRAAALLGGVLYAQSTQVTSETQAFVPGAAVRIPAHARIIGETHALNASPKRIETHLALALHVIPEAQVTTRLHPLALEYHPLDIAPNARSRFTMACDLAAQHPAGFRVHYVQPHYHGLGTGMRLEVMGGGRDGATIYEVASAAGETLGGVLDPPFELGDGRGIRVTCSYDNPRDQTVRWGIGDQEMCVLLAFTDSDVTWAGGAIADDGNRAMGTSPDGALLNASDCTVFAIKPHD